MRIHFSPPGKTVAGILLIGSALLIAGWTMAHNPKSDLIVQPSVPPMPNATTVVTQVNPLVKKVQDALAKKAELKGEEIKVEAAEDGKIRLSGKTSKSSKKVLAEKVATRVAGKKNVVNLLFTICNGQNCDGYCCSCQTRSGPACCCQSTQCTGGSC